MRWQVESRRPLRDVGGAWTTATRLYSPFVPAFQANTGQIRASLFLEPGRNRPMRRKPGTRGPDGAGAAAAEAVYGSRVTSWWTSHVAGAPHVPVGNANAGANVSQETSRGISGAVRGYLIPAANPLDGSSRPLADLIPGALAGGRDRYIQSRRDPAQRPAESTAAPNEHHHLFVVFLDLFLDAPRGGTPAHGVGDLSAVFLHVRHDTPPPEPGAARARSRSGIFPEIGLDPALEELQQAWAMANFRIRTG